MKAWATAGAVVLVAALVLVGAVGAQPEERQATPTVVKVSMYEMGFKLSKRIVPRGPVVFRVVNAGKLPHDFRISGKGTPVMNAGQRATVKVKFPKRGKFTFICTVEGHAGAGMVGKLTVR